MSGPELAPPAALSPEGARSAWRAPVLGMLGATVAFAVVMLLHNPQLFTDPIHEHSDLAADSLLILKAKRLELLHGHYSRLGFYHPGPATLYMLAGAEWLFHDQLGLVPAPHNAHILGQMLLYAALIGLSVGLIGRAAESGFAGAMAGVVFLVYFAREGHLSSHWFVYLFFLYFLSFQIAAASVASGRTAHLGWMALTASLTVHSHVCFVAFVLPVSLYALVRVFAKGGYRLRSLPASDRRAWVVFGGVVALFVLPIALHVALHYPGEIRRYLQVARQPKPEVTPTEVSHFLLETFTNGSALGWPLVVGAVSGAFLAVVSFRGLGRVFARQIGVVCLLSTAAMLYYAVRGVDDLKQTYLGVFFGSVLLLCWTLVALRVATFLNRGPTWRGLGLAVCAGVAIWAGTTGSFLNRYRGMPEIPALADAIAADPRWENGPVAISLHHPQWEQTAALLLELERRGKRAWVLDHGWDVLLTDQFRLAGRPVQSLWQIDAAGIDEPRTGVRRVLAEFGGASFREIETRCPFGQPIPLGRGERLPGARPTTGWSGTGAADFLIPLSAEAALLLDLPPEPPNRVRLTVRAQAIAWTGPEGLQRVGVFVNGERVGEVAFGWRQVEEHALEFAGELLTRQSPVEISFQFPDAQINRAGRSPGVVEKHSIKLAGIILSPVAP